MTALELVGTGPDLLVFLPGFLNSATSYRALLEPVAVAGTTVVVPQLYRRGPSALTGRFTVRDEARAAAELVRECVALRRPRAVFLGGHSRGGQAAWLAAGLLDPGNRDPGNRDPGNRDPGNRDSGIPDSGIRDSGDGDSSSVEGGAHAGRLGGVVLVDPVDGEGRAPTAVGSTATPAGFSCPALVIGAALGGRCAPEPVNHRVFAAATPQARYVVVSELGHADMLDGRGRAFGRRLCGGADDPDPGRAACSALIAAFVADALDTVAGGTVAAGLLDWRR